MKNMNKKIPLILALLVLVSSCWNKQLNEIVTDEKKIDNSIKNVKQDYIWLTVEEGKNLAKKNSVVFRVLEIDGQRYPGTMDYIIWRISASINDWIITSYTIEE